jgi:hypothetical protein
VVSPPPSLPSLNLFLTLLPQAAAHRWSRRCRICRQHIPRERRLAPRGRDGAPGAREETDADGTDGGVWRWGEP